MADSSSDVIELLAETRVFRDFPVPELKKIAARFRKETHPKGTVIYHKGDTGNKLYLIASGQVALLDNANGRESTVAVLGQGEIFGEMALLTGEPRSVSVRLDATSDLLVLDKKDFDDLMAQNPNIGIFLSQIISHRLARTMDPKAKGMDKRQPLESKLHLFVRLAPQIQGTLFTINLAVNLVEQSRRKVVLVELCLESKSAILAMLGLRADLPNSKELGSLPLRELLKKVKISHPCGLDIMAVPSSLFVSPQDREKAFVALNWLRSNYDHALLAATPLQWESLQSVFREVDEIYLVSGSSDQTENLSGKITQIIGQDEARASLREVHLISDGKDSFVDLAKIRVGWSRAIDKDYEQNRNPFEALNATRTLRAIERLARILAGLQIGLALGSGGALGYTILGILKILERERIYPDIIAGSSIGSLAGAMYARGLSIEEMTEIALSIDAGWIRDFVFWDLAIPRGGGFLGGVKLQRFLKTIYDDLEFKDLEIPLACIATDIRTGEEITIREGRVLDAVRASIAIPVIFKPHLFQGRLLVDGGLVNPVPSSTLIQMGAALRLAVRLTSSPSERKSSIGLLGKKQEEESLGVLDVFFRTILTMSHQIAASKEDVAHVTIHPKTPNFNWKDFSRAQELITLGEAAAEEALPKIKALLPFFADYCATRLKT